MRQANQEKSSSDQELFAEFLTGDSATAFHNIYRRHAAQIERYCLAKLGNMEDARDAVQDTFMTLLKRKETLHAVELLHYLRRTARFVVSECLRKRRPAESITHNIGRGEHQAAWTGESQLELMDQEEEWHTASIAMAAMKPEDQTVLRLRYVEGENTKTIAVMLNISEEAVRARLRRALKRLSEQLNSGSGNSSNCR